MPISEYQEPSPKAIKNRTPIKGKLDKMKDEIQGKVQE